MRLVILLVLALGGTGGSGSAQPRAVEVESTREHHRHRHGPAGLGASAAFGWAGQKDGPSGWSTRLEYEVFPLYGAGNVGGVFGTLAGAEVWRSGEDNWGFSLPVGFVGGVRVLPLRAMIGGGIDAIVIDQVDDDTGFGFYAPFALARLGFDIAGFQVGADARIGYRWQLGAPDHTRWQLGLFVARTVEAPAPRRRARAVAVAADP